MTLRAVVNPGLDIFAGVQLSILKVVVYWQPGGTVPEWRVETAINQLKYLGNFWFWKKHKFYLHEFFVYLVEILDTAVFIILISFDETPGNKKKSPI